MDNRQLRDLDNYITGDRYHKETHTLECPNCGVKKEVEMECEYGGCTPVNEDESYCSECNSECNIEMG